MAALSNRDSILPPGPWADEPDAAQFTHAGLQCSILRNEVGTWCGYVAVPEGHPLYGAEFRDVAVRVHGGLTFSELRPSGWTFGFDCVHGYDLIPALAFVQGSDVVYRDIEYVTAEVKRLAEQLARLAV